MNHKSQQQAAERKRCKEHHNAVCVEIFAFIYYHIRPDEAYHDPGRQAHQRPPTDRERQRHLTHTSTISSLTTAPTAPIHSPTRGTHTQVGDLQTDDPGPAGDAGCVLSSRSVLLE